MPTIAENILNCSIGQNFINHRIKYSSYCFYKYWYFTLNDKTIIYELYLMCLNEDDIKTYLKFEDFKGPIFQKYKRLYKSILKLIVQQRPEFRQPPCSWNEI